MQELDEHFHEEATHDIPRADEGSEDDAGALQQPIGQAPATSV